MKYDVETYEIRETADAIGELRAYRKFSKWAEGGLMFLRSGPEWNRSQDFATGEWRARLVWRGGILIPRTEVKFGEVPEK